MIMINTRATTNFKDESGFTLIEILLAVGILGFIMSISYGAIGSIVRTKRILEDEQEIERIDHVLVRRLTQEFQLSYPGIPRLPPRDNLDERFHSNDNMLGEEDSLSNGRPGDSITFVALSAGQYFMEGKNANAGLVQISYRVLEDPEREKEEDYPVYSLVREEVPYTRPFDTVYDQAVRFPLVEIVESFQLEYFDIKSETWTRTWGDGDRTGLPAMIRFTIEVRSPEGKPRIIQGTAPLRAKRVR